MQYLEPSFHQSMLLAKLLQILLSGSQLFDLLWFLQSGASWVLAKFGSWLWRSGCWDICANASLVCTIVHPPCESRGFCRLNYWLSPWVRTVSSKSAEVLLNWLVFLHWRFVLFYICSFLRLSRLIRISVFHLPFWAAFVSYPHYR